MKIITIFLLLFLSCSTSNEINSEYVCNDSLIIIHHDSTSIYFNNCDSVIGKIRLQLIIDSLEKLNDSCFLMKNYYYNKKK